jgi:hypothetical protein
MAKGRRAKGAKAKTPSGRSRQATRKKAAPAGAPKPKEEEPRFVATKPVAKPSIGLSDIGRLAKSAIFWQRARARDAEVERPEAHRHQVRKGGEASSISQERGGLKTDLTMAPSA